MLSIQSMHGENFNYVCDAQKLITGEQAFIWPLKQNLLTGYKSLQNLRKNIDMAKIFGKVFFISARPTIFYL